MIVRSGPPRPPAARASQGPGIGIERVGPVDAVPCPWCQRAQDFRAHAGSDMGGVGEGSVGLEHGAIFSCTPGCRRKFRIVWLGRELLVRVRAITDPLRPERLPAQPITAGLLKAVRCPWCRRTQDFRAHVGADMGGVGEGSVGVEHGAIFSCAPGCGRKFRIVHLERMLMVRVRPVREQPPAQAQPRRR